MRATSPSLGDAASAPGLKKSRGGWGLGAVVAGPQGLQEALFVRLRGIIGLRGRVGPALAAPRRRTRPLISSLPATCRTRGSRHTQAAVALIWPSDARSALDQPGKTVSTALVLCVSLRQRNPQQRLLKATRAWLRSWVTCTAEFALGVTLIAFFVSSSLLTRVGGGIKCKTDEHYKCALARRTPPHGLGVGVSLAAGVGREHQSELRSAPPHSAACYSQGARLAWWQGGRTTRLGAGGV